MRVDSLGKLETVFGRWRAKKSHVRERVPEKLMERAGRAAAVHGVYAAARAAKIEYRRLAESMAASKGASQLVQRGPDAESSAVARTTARRAKPAATAATRAKKRPAAVPSYSRLEIPARETTTCPIAEVETPAGMKLRVFALTPETVALLSTLSGPGRAS
jgi:hypothetical protein